MEFSNDGISVYHRSLAIYARHADGELIRCLGTHAEKVNSSWNTLRSAIMAAQSTPLRSTEDHVLSRLRINGAVTGFENIEIYEMQRYQQNTTTGLILTGRSETSAVASDFDEFFSSLIFTQTKLDTTPPTSQDESIVNTIVDLFDKELRYQVPNDQWGIKGREYFSSKVRFYTSRNRRLEMCLPAFPCKSSNPKKVVGVSPDRGEEMALRRLHGFVQQVEQVYKPGARVWIISDGHVFSDCSKFRFLQQIMAVPG